MNKSGMFTAKAVQYAGTEQHPASPDKNGKTPIFLRGISGAMPNRNVLSGTVAENEGFEAGKVYQCSWIEGQNREFKVGNKTVTEPNIIITNLGEVTDPVALAQLSGILGASELHQVERLSASEAKKRQEATADATKEEV